MSGPPEYDRTWTNASVERLSPGTDPLATMSGLVNDILLSAADAGAVSAPTDPFQLASLMGIGLRPHFDVADARLVTDPAGAPAASADSAPLARFVPSNAALVIEYNPTRPRGRLRYSVAHELAHALFPDAADQPRHRTATGAVAEHAVDDSWQLELLCNIAAAEILMPAAAIEGLVNIDTDIDFLMAQRARFHVSTEALLRRLVHATDRPMALAAFNRLRDTLDSPVRCDYVLASRAWNGTLRRGTLADPAAGARLPAAVGQTTRGTMTVEGTSWQMQAVGIPAYPGRALSRVLALLEPTGPVSDGKPRLTYVTGDIAEAVDPDAGPIVIAHVVSDSARTWSKFGAGGALAAVVPDAARAFRAWSIADGGDNLTLGNVHTVTVQATTGRQVTVVSLVAQVGYGPSSSPRLSYVALAEALDRLAEVAHAIAPAPDTGPTQQGDEGDRGDRGSRGGGHDQPAALADGAATVHMPRIGAGQGGGRWDLIEATIERSLLERDVPVVVHTLPSRASSPARARAQG